MAGVRRFVVWAALGFGACTPARPAAEPLGETTRHTPAHSQRGPSSVNVDASKLEVVLVRRMDQAIARPAFDQAMKELLTSLTSDDSLSAQGEALFEALGKDPRLAARAAEFQESLGNEPAMTELVTRLMADHPGASPDQIGELAGEHIDRQTGSQAFDEAFDLAIDRLFERPQLNAAFDDFGAAAANNPQFERGITTALHDIDYRPLVKRLSALDGGREPDAARTSQLLIDHAFTTDRIEALVLDWLHLPETRSELRRLTSDVLQAPSFRRRVATLFFQLLSDPDVQASLRDCFVVLLDAHPNQAQMKERFRKGLDTPRMDTMLASFVKELMQDPALRTLGSRFLERVANSQGFETSMQRFMMDW